MVAEEVGTRGARGKPENCLSTLLTFALSGPLPKALSSKSYVATLSGVFYSNLSLSEGLP